MPDSVNWVVFPIMPSGVGCGCHLCPWWWLPSPFLHSREFCLFFQTWLRKRVLLRCHRTTADTHVLVRRRLALDSKRRAVILPRRALSGFPGARFWWTKFTCGQIPALHWSVLRIKFAGSSYSARRLSGWPRYVFSSSVRWALAYLWRFVDKSSKGNAASSEGNCRVCQLCISHLRVSISPEQPMRNNQGPIPVSQKACSSLCSQPRTPPSLSLISTF